ncbi:fibronectin type III domain-containing protein [Bifidobacterium pullorum subsp. saeculare]|uniref:Fibronectin type III domain-containing protein n=1 Tax=Bifidobacterium pullorum subsp. saeculare TaxID=78257 RepID=A0A939B896_9BIFI|nr:Ig-like domain-containing protein [Bifidobacterium pullorum]MBM6699677.1 fibronectin type III domain-containing protein [Bifidobacterium pullorum subsp. saeculare]
MHPDIHRPRRPRRAFPWLRRRGPRRPGSPSRGPLAQVPVALAVLAAMLAGAAVVSSVNERQTTFDDGTVWVVSASHGKAARLNVEAGQAEATVETPAPGADVAQHGGLVALAEGARVRLVDAATAQAGEPIALQGRAVAVANGGTLAVVEPDSGLVWARDEARVRRLAPAVDRPCLRLGSGGLVAVDDEGLVWGYRPSDGMVLAVMPGVGRVPREVGSLSGGKQLGVDAFTVVDGTPVALADGQVLTPYGRAEVRLEPPLMLQAPPVDGDQSGWVVAAGTGGVAAIRLPDGGKPPSVVLHQTSGGHGQAAEPVSVLGCVHVAWGQAARNYVRLCSPEDRPRFRSLASVAASADLRLRANHRRVVVNDMAEGTVWVPETSDEAVAVDWSLGDEPQAVAERSASRSSGQSLGFAAACSQVSGSIGAVDDHVAVRAGGRALVDVLRNDRRTDCSVLRVEELAGSAGGVDASVVADGRLVQVDASRAQAGTAELSYTVTDGRGGVASAEVTVEVVGSGNRAPTQEGPVPERWVERGASAEAQALAGFVDPDGDALALTGARVVPQEAGEASVRADGRLVFHASPTATGRASVEVSVSDGRASGTGSVVFHIVDEGTLPPAVDPVTVSTTPGTDIVVDLAPYIRATGVAAVTLASVDAPDGVTVSSASAASMQSRDAGPKSLVLRLSAQVPGTQYVPYAVAQGAVETTGLIRLEVRGRDDAREPAAPVVMDDVAVLDGGGVAVAEPLANDMAPQGGVLALASASVPEGAGVRVSVLGHRRLLVRANRMPSEPVPVQVRVEGPGGGSAGTVTVLPPASRSATGPPRIEDMRVRVRTGGTVGVRPDDHVAAGSPPVAMVERRLQTDGDFRGLAFVSGDTVRYLAPDEPGEHQATVTVRGEGGETARFALTFAVHRSEARGKPAPTPRPAEARAAAGGTVRIPIELSGIDRDGDDVQLLGLGDVAPKLGRIVEVGADHLVYEAYADSQGTDTFSYAVEDWTGQRAQASVRVGVFRARAVQPPVTRDDTVVARPGATVVAPVLLNDESADGSELALAGIESSQGVSGVAVDGDRIRLLVPQEATGLGYVAYRVRDGAGLTAQAMLTVRVDAKAAPEPPQAMDVRVPPADTVDRRAVEVDVGPWVSSSSSADGSPEVGVHASAGGRARLKAGSRSMIVVDLTDRPRAVPYVVTDPATGLASIAFIHVPAYGVFPPMRRPNAPELTVRAGGTLEIPLAEQVRVGAGKEPLVIDAASASATKSDGSSLVVDERTLRFTAARDYAGPASLTVTVADGRPGRSRTGPDGDADTTIVTVARLTLPITVLGDGNRPPSFAAPVVEVPAGGGTELDLAALTTPSPGSGRKELSYRGGLDQAGVRATLAERGVLAVTARATAEPGTMVRVPVAIVHGGGTLEAKVGVRVVASTKPLARVPGGALRVVAGASASLQVLAGAYDPFPDDPLRLERCAVEGGDDAGQGLTVSCDGAGMLTATVRADAPAGVRLVTATVADATGRGERTVTATVEVTVVAPPGAPLLSPKITRPGPDAVELAWSPGVSGGLPVTGHEVRVLGPGAPATHRCAASAPCTVEGLEQGHIYRFAVRAQNDAGWSPWSNEVKALVDQPPPAPDTVTVEGGHRTVTVTWTMPRYAGSPPDRYAVALQGLPDAVTVRGVLSHTFHVPDARIRDGLAVAATVSAGNQAGMGPAAASPALARPYGSPSAPSVAAELEALDGIGDGGVRSEDAGGGIAGPQDDGSPSDGSGGASHGYQNDAVHPVRVTVAGVLGDMRNTVCAAVELSVGAKTAAQVPCGAIRASFTLSAAEVKRLDGMATPRITVRTRQGPSVSADGRPLALRGAVTPEASLPAGERSQP